MRTEKGGTISQDKTVYVGHSTSARDKLLRVAMHALVRRMAHKFGFNIKSFKEGVVTEFLSGAIDVLDIAIEYKIDRTTALTASSYVAQQTDTWESVADGLLTQLQSDIGSTATDVEYYKFRAIPKSQEATSVLTAIPVSIDLTQTKLHMFVESELTIQNRTLAASGAGDTEHQFHMNSVENNPIEGKQYFCAGNGFVTRHGFQTGATSVEFLCDDASGVITGDPDDGNLSSKEKDLLQRPVNAHYWRGCKHASRVMLTPGALKRSVLKSSHHVYFNQFMKSMGSYFEDGAETQKIYFGKARMYAFEKMMHTGDAEDPADINIGWEVNNKYGGYVTEGRAAITMDKDVL
jgi:hypothetical protein